MLVCYSSESSLTSTFTTTYSTDLYLNWEEKLRWGSRSLVWAMGQVKPRRPDCLEKQNCEMNGENQAVKIERTPLGPDISVLNSVSS